MSTNQPIIATVKNPLIEAVVNGLYRHPTKEAAVEQLNALKEHFVTSRHKAPEGAPEPNIIMWIKGYEIVATERKEGYLGNFALITLQPVDGRFTLVAQKMPAELKFHPQSKRPKRDVPDLGHPILREIQKQPIFNTVEEAQERLQALHEAFPKVSIPNVMKLYTMIYSRRHEGDPIRKYVLEIKAHPEGGFFIDVSENTYQKSEPLPHQVEKTDERPGYHMAQATIAQKQKEARAAQKQADKDEK